MNQDLAGMKRNHEKTGEVSSAPQAQPEKAASKGTASPNVLEASTVSNSMPESGQEEDRRAGSDAEKTQTANSHQQDVKTSDVKTQDTPETSKTTSQIGDGPGIIRQYELVERVKEYDPSCDEGLINRAYVFAMKAHGGQTRKSGDPYFTHPIAVAAILTELKADPETIITALLHDTVEDTDATIEQIRDLFGGSIAHLVDGVTKLSKYEMRSDASKEAENFRKFVIAMSKDVRVLLVKLADRLHNMRTLHHITKAQKQQRIALETMQIYAPLAGRIGVQKFREELEDLSFKYLNVDVYHSIQENLERLSKTTVRSVVLLAQTLRQKLEECGVTAEVYSREKRPFSIWRKMQRKNHAFEQLADIYAFRVIVPNVDECYRALGVIHQNFRMLPDEFDDYISTPKTNNYRSIHTAVLAPMDESGIRQRVEVQIRTKAMHESAERGIAAHWRYKDSSAQTERARVIEIENSEDYDPYDWVRNAVEMLQHGDDADEFLENAKLDLFQDQVFCFTPKGRVISLPHGAMPLDFAYALHTDIGHSCVGAMVNGLNMPLRTVLRNGDVVRVLRSDNAPIPQNWENRVVTGRAKAGLKKRVNLLKKKDQVKLGRRLLESELTAYGITISDTAIEDALKKLGHTSVENVFIAVGSLQMAPGEVVKTIYPGTVHPSADEGGQVVTKKQSIRRAVSLEGLERGVSVHLGICCNPLPGERIVGLPEEGGSIEVHRIDCDALATTKISEEKWLDLKWRDSLDGGFVAPISVIVNNRIGALAHVAAILAHYEVDIVDIRLIHREVEFNEILTDILIKDLRHLTNVLTGLRASEHVVSADRRQIAPDETTEA